MKLNIGMQFYTLRNEMSQGYEAIFKRIAEVGYTGVEMTYSPKDGDTISELLKKYNLKGTGAHIGMDAIDNDLETVTGFMDKLGSKNIILPWIGDEIINSEEKTIATAERMETAAKKLNSLGYELGFHNHIVEFERKFNGKTVIDIFYEYAPSLKFQVDVGWAYAGGADVVAVLNKLGNRLVCIHIKDVDEKNTPTEIGSGKVDMKSVIDTAAKLGVKWGIVEQDSCVNYPAFESIKISYDYIKTIN